MSVKYRRVKNIEISNMGTPIFDISLNILNDAVLNTDYVWLQLMLFFFNLLVDLF